MNAPKTARWVPTEYVDDTTPVPRAHPQDWIVRDSDGTPYLAEGHLAFEEGVQKRSLKSGERVDFDWIVVIGTWAWTGTDWEPPLPSFMPGSSGWQAAVYGDILMADEVTPEDNDAFKAPLYCWSERSVPFTFINGRFVRAAGAA